jgi:hypothetical protein
MVPLPQDRHHTDQRERAAARAAIYFSCEWFVGAVEWPGQRLNVGRMAVGTILAAFRHRASESVVTWSPSPLAAPRSP